MSGMHAIWHYSGKSTEIIQYAYHCAHNIHMHDKKGYNTMKFFFSGVGKKEFYDIWEDPTCKIRSVM